MLFCSRTGNARDMQIFFNGTILTQDARQLNAEAMAVSEGKIKAIGTLDELRPLQSHGGQMIDLHGKILVPGFIDAHVHIWKVGNLLTYMLDLRGVRSFEEMADRLLSYRQQFPEAQWILARGFNEATMREGRIPDRRDLDRIIPDQPVCLIRTCAHVAVVNTLALEKCNVTASTPIPAGGEIRRDAAGQPNGIFSETALGLVMDHIPPYTAAQYQRMILTAQQELFRAGITSASDPAVMPDLEEAYRLMDRNGELSLRVNAFPIRIPDGGHEVLSLPERYESSFLKIDTVKFFADGGLSGKTAALLRPYRNSQDFGMLRLERDSFYRLAHESQQMGFRIATHAIGDRAIGLVVDVYQALQKDNDAGLRHRIEHLGLPGRRELDAMQQMGTHSVAQSIFLYELGLNFRKYLPDDYLEQCYPLRSVLEHGINLSLSSDAPVVRDFSPLRGIQCAVERCDAEGNVIGESQRISPAEALYAYTMGSALANGDEASRGSLEVGKWADCVVLDADPTQTPSGKISGIEVLETYVGGERVFSSREKSC